MTSKKRKRGRRPQSLRLEVPLCAAEGFAHSAFIQFSGYMRQLFILLPKIGTRMVDLFAFFSTFGRITGPKKMKKETRHSSRRHSDLKVRSVSELARLVTSGAVRVPKSLVDYVNDRVQLLDQIFTILSPADIKGMLPDILKGLKMKYVKRLCYEQLKAMSVNRITDFIRKEGSPPASLSLTDSQPHFRPPLGHVSSPTSTDTPGNASVAQTTQTALETKSPKDVTSPPQATYTCSTSTNASSRVPVTSATPFEPTEDFSTTRMTLSPVDEFVISVSDVSDEETCHKLGTCNETLEEQPLVECHKADVSHTAINEMDSDTSSCFEEDDLSCVPEAALLLEMEFRRRALESELKRVNSQGGDVPSNSGDTPIDQQDVQSTSPTFEGDIVKPTIGFDVSQLTSRSPQESSSDVMEVEFGVLLEMKLRQKALQSLLAKRKKSN